MALCRGLSLPSSSALESKVAFLCQQLSPFLGLAGEGADGKMISHIICLGTVAINGIVGFH